MTTNINLEEVPDKILEEVMARIMASRQRANDARQYKKPKSHPQPQFRKQGASIKRYKKPEPAATLVNGKGLIISPRYGLTQDGKFRVLTEDGQLLAITRYPLVGDKRIIISNNLYYVLAGGGIMDQTLFLGDIIKYFTGKSYDESSLLYAGLNSTNVAANTLGKAPVLERSTITHELIIDLQKIPVSFAPEGTRRSYGEIAFQIMAKEAVFGTRYGFNITFYRISGSDNIFINIAASLMSPIAWNNSGVITQTYQEETWRGIRTWTRETSEEPGAVEFRDKDLYYDNFLPIGAPRTSIVTLPSYSFNRERRFAGVNLIAASYPARYACAIEQGEHHFAVTFDKQTNKTALFINGKPITTFQMIDGDILSPDFGIKPTTWCNQYYGSQYTGDSFGFRNTSYYGFRDYRITPGKLVYKSDFTPPSSITSFV